MNISPSDLSFGITSTQSADASNYYNLRLIDNISANLSSLIAERAMAINCKHILYLFNKSGHINILSLIYTSFLLLLAGGFSSSAYRYCNDIHSFRPPSILHFIIWGIKEGRRFFPSCLMYSLIPIPIKSWAIKRLAAIHDSYNFKLTKHLVDADFYYSMYPDVKQAGVDAALHYFNQGWREYRMPCSWFNPKYVRHNLSTQHDDHLSNFTDHNYDNYMIQSSRNCISVVFNSPSFINYMRSCTIDITDSINSQFDFRRALKDILFLQDIDIARCCKITSAANYTKYYTDTSPEVSVIVLNYNNAPLTLNCLCSIISNTTSLPYNIIVIDNGSRSGDFDLLSKANPFVNIVRLSTNRYFGEANNIGADIAKGKYLAFVNNDTILSPDWLLPLLNCLKRVDSAGIAGSVLLNDDLSIQEVGATVLDDGSVRLNYLNMSNSDIPDIEHIEVDYCSAASILVRRDDFMRLCGFDYIYDPAYYEDVDLAYKFKQNGLSSFVCTKSNVFHVGASTWTSNANELNSSNLVDYAKTKFVNRWKGRRFSDIARNRIAVSGKPIATSSKRAIVFTPDPLILGGGEKYLFSLCRVLSNFYNIILSTPETYSTSRIYSLMSDMKIEISNMEYVRQADLGRPQDGDILVTIGLSAIPFHQTIYTKNYHICQFPQMQINDNATLTNIDNWNSLDLIICYSLFVKNEIKRFADRSSLERKQIEVIYPPCAIETNTTNSLRKSDNPVIILSVGRFISGGNDKNQDMLIEAFIKLAGSIKSNAELHLAGATLPDNRHREFYLKCVAMARNLPIYFHPNITSGDLCDLYNRAYLYWHGAGAKANCAQWQKEHFGITIVEAMNRRCICVAPNAGGIPEIIEDGRSGYLYNYPEELVKMSASLIRNMNAGYVCEIQNRAFDRSKSFSTEEFTRRVKSIFSLPA